MLTYILDGGPIMWPLMILSILTFAIIIDRVRAFRAAGSDFDDLRREVNENLLDEKIDEAITRVEAADGPVAACLLVGLQRYRKMRERKREPEEIETAVSKMMEDFAPKAISGLEKRLNLLVLIASVSPLLGMTGTVTGMIKSFDKMAEAAGLDPAAVSSGIAEALITTATGLIVAIPAVVAYNLFSRRVEEYNIAIEECVTDVVTAISEH
ncbi:MAG: MotA/TolQ/ExbB proton channel family protein [Verrucomicrobia bacterium]|nr:MotA/TolQ/ExbB proton channel family protein [Verrucomicrobiota bacterium]MCH8511605.1 MotA/TolQ/ExbB proton channel family protein [Kiritimatiellia bacterium]